MVLSSEKARPASQRQNNASCPDYQIELQLSDDDIDRLLTGKKVQLATFTFLGYPVNIKASVRRLNLRSLVQC